MPGIIGPDSPSPNAPLPQGGAGLAGSQQNAQLLQGIYGPSLAMSQGGYQQQYDALQNQLALYGQATTYQEGLVNQDLSQQLAQYGLQREGVGLSQQSLGATEALTEQQYGIGLQQFGLQGQSLDQQLAQAQYGYGQGMQQLTQGTAAAGTLNSGTYSQGKANLGTQLGFQEQTIGRERSQLGLSEQSAANQFTYQGQQIANQAKQLDLSLKSLGLNEANAKTKADQAIAQLGLQGQISADQVLQQLGALQQGQASNLTGVLPQILSLMQGTSGSLSGAGSGGGPQATAGSGSGPWSIFSNGGNAAAQTWAQDLLSKMGAPATPANLKMVYDWEKSEGGGGKFNPLNQGPVPGHPELSGGSQYGGGAASYVSYDAGLQGAVDYLNMPNYTQVRADLMAGQGDAAAQALWASPWAESHYGNGANWSNAAYGG